MRSWHWYVPLPWSESEIQYRKNWTERAILIKHTRMSHMSSDLMWLTVTWLVFIFPGGSNATEEINYQFQFAKWKMKNENWRLRIYIPFQKWHLKLKPSDWHSTFDLISANKYEKLAFEWKKNCGLKSNINMKWLKEY